MQTFPIAPAVSKAYWFIPVLVLFILAFVAVLMVGTVRGARTSQFDVAPAGLSLRGDWYGRTIPWSDIDASGVKRVDFVLSPELRPARRTIGTGLPGYSAGWFRLRGGERALVYLTDRSRAVYVPTTRGYSVLISPADPDGFIAALRDAAGGRS
jgi:hypothetical protein